MRDQITCTANAYKYDGLQGLIRYKVVQKTFHII